MPKGNPAGYLPNVKRKHGTYSRSMARKPSIKRLPSDPARAKIRRATADLSQGQVKKRVTKLLRTVNSKEFNTFGDERQAKIKARLGGTRFHLKGREGLKLRNLTPEQRQKRLKKALGRKRYRKFYSDRVRAGEKDV